VASIYCRFVLINNAIVMLHCAQILFSNCGRSGTSCDLQSRCEYALMMKLYRSVFRFKRFGRPKIHFLGQDDYFYYNFNKTCYGDNKIWGVIVPRGYGPEAIRATNTYATQPNIKSIKIISYNLLLSVFDRGTGIGLGSMAARVGGMLTPFTIELQNILPWLTQVFCFRH